ncbi:MAG: XRE family transcriptional regulator [Treponema sp.]|nr:XRE family transcriptional regulator [Treponema sp.]
MNEHIGSSFDDFLEEEGIREEVENAAVKKVIALGMQSEMAAKNITKTQMAQRMGTSRAAVDRLLNPYNNAVTLATLTKAANVLGKKLVLRMV